MLFLTTIITTLALGSLQRQGLMKVRAKREARESHFMLSKVWEGIREWTSTFPSELPLWELESQWTSKFSENDCRRQNPLVHYIIGKFLELRCPDSKPLKVENCLDFLVWRWHATYRWKALDEGYNFASIGGLHTKLWASKVARDPILRISGLPLWNPGTKWHLGANPVAKRKV